MANEFIMAIGLSYLLHNEENDKEPPSVIATMGHINSSSSVLSAGERDKGYLIFESYEKAEVLIKYLYIHASNLNNNISEEKN